VSNDAHSQSDRKAEAAALRPWVGASIGISALNLKCNTCQFDSNDAGGHTIALGLGVSLRGVWEIGIVRRSFTESFEAPAIRSVAYLATTQYVIAERFSTQGVVRGAVGFEQYRAGSLTARANVFGGGLGLVFNPRAHVSPTIFYDQSLLRGRMAADGVLPGGEATGGRKGFSAGLTVR